MYKHIVILISVFAAIMSGVAAQEAAGSSLPPCAAVCIVQAIINSTCAPTDTTCTCSNPSLISQSTECILAECSVREALASQNITNTQCGVVPVVDHSFFVPMLVFIVITGIAVALRLTSRIVTGTKFWWDDLLNLVAIAALVTFASVSFVCRNLGLGTDIWAVPQDDITPLLKLSFAQFNLYNLSRVAIRDSIILFLLRVFTMGPRRTLWVMLWINNLVFFIFIFINIFQCSPVEYFWLSWDGEHQGHCMSSRVISWVSAIWDLAYDLVLLVLPFPYVLKLNLPRKQKIAASVMFAVGISTVVVSIVRLKAVNTFTVGTNTTRDAVGMFLWTNLELNVGLLCACLPSIYPLFKPILARFQRNTVQADSERRFISSFRARVQKKKPGLYSDISMTGFEATSGHHSDVHLAPTYHPGGGPEPNDMRKWTTESVHQFETRDRLP